MEMFPFPDRSACITELKLDRFFSRIPTQDHEKILNAAWQRGEQAAEDFFGSGPVDIRQAMQAVGLQIEELDQDMVIGGTRYFAEIYVKAKKVNVYLTAVALWAQHNCLPLAQAEELLLAHEFFHYLEHTALPPARDVYQVPSLKLFGRTLLRSGLRCVSEIGAHSFANAYWKRITKADPPVDKF